MIRRRRECTWRRLRRGSGRREAGRGSSLFIPRQGTYTRPIPTPPHLRLLGDEMPCRKPRTTAYTYVFLTCKYLHALPKHQQRDPAR